MIYAFQYVYILAILLMQYRNGKRWLPIALAVMLGLISWSNLIFANQLYLKKALQEEAALSLMTRVVDDIEDFEGYIPGQTPVAFVGCFVIATLLFKVAVFDFTFLPYVSVISQYTCLPSTVEDIVAEYVEEVCEDFEKLEAPAFL